MLDAYWLLLDVLYSSLLIFIFIFAISFVVLQIVERCYVHVTQRQLRLQNANFQVGTEFEDGIKIVHVSDIHFDRNASACSEDHLDEVIEKIEAAQADLVLISGDFIIKETKPIHELAERLGKLKPVHGVYAGLGNHECYAENSRNICTEALTKNGITVLRNKICQPIKGFPLHLAGLEDQWMSEWQDHPSIMADLEKKDGIKIVLSHNPDSAVTLRKYGFDLMLAGHTHGGQICLPGFPFFTSMYPFIKPGIPVLAIVRRLIDNIPPLKGVIYGIPFFKNWANLHKFMWVMNHWEWAHGMFQLDKTEISEGRATEIQNGERYMHVSRGIGAHYSLRLFCQPEVTELTILPSDPPMEKSKSQ